MASERQDPTQHTDRAVPPSDFTKALDNAPNTASEAGDAKGGEAADGREYPEPEYAVEESALSNDCDLWFALPPGFVEVPLEVLSGEVSQEQADDLLTAVQTLLDLLPPERHEEFVTQLREAGELPGLLRQSGLSHCAVGLHAKDDGQPLQSILTLVWRENPWAPPKLTAARAALAAARDAVAADHVDLPCGPAAVAETVTEQQGRKVQQATGYLPHPDGRRLVVVTLSSTAADARGYLRDMLDGILQMVSFDNPLPEHIQAEIPESETTASVRAAFG